MYLTLTLRRLGLLLEVEAEPLGEDGLPAADAADDDGPLAHLVGRLDDEAEEALEESELLAPVGEAGRHVVDVQHPLVGEDAPRMAHRFPLALVSPNDNLCFMSVRTYVVWRGG